MDAPGDASERCFRGRRGKIGRSVPCLALFPHLLLRCLYCGVNTCQIDQVGNWRQEGKGEGGNEGGRKQREERRQERPGGKIEDKKGEKEEKREGEGGFNHTMVTRTH